MNDLKIHKNKFDIGQIRKDFPILSRMVNDSPLIYLDNGATAQKPEVVINTIHHFYNKLNSNIHRGVHTLSQEATDAYERARRLSKDYFNAAKVEEVIFTSGTTDSINLIATVFGNTHIQKGDEVIITEMEHHSNIVPWQMICQSKGAHLKVIPITDSGDLNMDVYKELLNEKTKIVAVSHISNVLGTVNPIEEIVREAHKLNIPVLVDGAQAAPHLRIDLQELDCDFYVYSAHKMFGPTGIGMLYGKEEWLESLPPYRGGGEMIKEVSFEKTTYNDLPYKFEAGTPNIAAGIGLAAAIEYLQALDFEAIHAHENQLLKATEKGLGEIDGIRFIGTSVGKSSICAFVIDGVHHYDVGMILDKMGIAVRTGHNCAQPLMNRFEITGTVRASYAMYNTLEEVEQLVAGVKKAVKMLR